MDKNYIRSISLNEDWNDGDFRISPSNGCIQCRIKEGLVDNIDSMKDSRRASKASDLLSLLKLRNYNLLDSKGINPSSGELGFISEYDEDGCASRIEVLSSHISLNDIQKITSLQSELMNMQIGYIPGTYIENGTGDYSYPERYGLRENYYNFRLVLDLIDKSSIINVMTLNGDEYTDVLDLGRILSDNSGYSSVSVRLGIKFTRKDRPEIVSIKEMIFPYDLDIQNDVEGLVKVEYLDKCIRLFPSNDVNECVVSYCHLMCKLK